MKFHFVVNPAGASGAAGRTWERLEKALDRRGADYEVCFSSPGRGIRQICEELCGTHERRGSGREDVLRLVVVGGDGSFGEAINGIRDPEDVLLGLIPSGSGNDMARDMGLPQDPEILLDRILKGERVRLQDLGRITYLDGQGAGESRLFHVSCGMGFDAAICRAANTSRWKSLLNKVGLGKIIYLLCAFRLILVTRRYPFTFRIDEGEVTETEGLLFAVAMNRKYEGGGFQFCPQAEADDGQLDLCLVNPRSNLSFFTVFPHAYRGKHVKWDFVRLGRGRCFDFQSRFPLWVHTDGEALYQASHIRLEIAEKSLQLLM